MAITFSWSVEDMHRVVATGAVYRVELSCSGVDADTKLSHSRSGSYEHTASVTNDAVIRTEADDTEVLGKVTRVVPVTPDHTASGFKPYSDLTEADVLAWCKADGVGAEIEAKVTANITNKIAAQANSTGMPWAAE